LTYAIRPYRADDAAVLAEVFHRAVSITGAKFYTPEQISFWLFDPPDAESIDAKNSDGRLALVAVGENDRPIAWIDLEPGGHIDMLFCAPEHAGKGVASVLYRNLEQHARAMNLSRLFVEASEGARPVFEHWGFRTLHRRDIVENGRAIHNYAMEKSIAPPGT
jgi:putative acetyltransferase